MFTSREFESFVRIDEKRVKKSSNEIQESFNYDKNDPRDGELIRAVDHLAAYVEAYLAVRNGVRNEVLETAKTDLRRKYEGEESGIAGLDFAAIYADFKG